MPTVNDMTQAPALPRHRRLAGFSYAETGLMLAVVALFALALAGPLVHDSVHQHGFADQRTLLGLPCALDVLSNLPFAIAGLWGLALLRRLPPADGAQPVDGTSRWLAALFFGGLVFTAAGSSYYHLRPTDAGLLWDRMGMVLPFAGLLGLAAHSRVSTRAGGWAAALVLAGGAAALAAWARSGNVLPWAVVQLGGMAVVLALALLPRRVGTLAPHLGAVIGLYAAAKLFEAADHAVFEATQHWLSGHSIKHVLAAGAAWPVLAALQAAGAGVTPRDGGGAQATTYVTASGQNGAHAVGAAAQLPAAQSISKA